MTPVKSQIGMLRLVQHVFQPISAVRDLNRHPVGLVILHAAMPVRTEPENLAIEMIFCLLVIHEKANVDHSTRHCRCRRRRVLLPYRARRIRSCAPPDRSSRS